MSMLRSLALTFAAALSAVVLAAQQSSPVHDTVQAAGPQYGAGGLRQLLLGREYRSLWTTPISVEVLDLRTFAGGLRPVSRGGGEETKALLFQGQDGREFLFRSVDKDPSATLPPGCKHIDAQFTPR